MLGSSSVFMDLFFERMVKSMGPEIDLEFSHSDLQRVLGIDCCGFSGFFDPFAFNAPYPKKIIYNGPATIVFWEDGTKTIVKRAKKEKDNKYNAFCAALAKKIFGNNSRVNAIVKSGIEEK